MVPGNLVSRIVSMPITLGLKFGEIVFTCECYFNVKCSVILVPVIVFFQTISRTYISYPGEWDVNVIEIALARQG